TSQDPGSLGVYGFRNRDDYSYSGLSVVDAKSIRDLAMWDQVAREGKKAHIIGVPPNYPPRKTSGISVGCFLTPDTTRNVYAHPPSAVEEINQLVGEYPADVKGFRTDDKDWLRDHILAMSRKQFQVVRHIMKTKEWDYLQFVEIGLDRTHHGFWKYHDPEHRKYEAGNPYENVVRDYYLHLDEEVGRVLELLDDETSVLILSDHGAQRLDGGFCVNQWLVDEGLLVLKQNPSEPTPWNQLQVDWEKTKAWGAGGYYARIFINVKGREPTGVIEQNDYEKFRDELKAKLEATVDDRGEPMGTIAFKPEETYRNVKNIPPDLMVHFGGLYWRSVAGVGYPSVYVQENDTGPDDCNHAQFGAFILAAPGLPVQGEFQKARLLDMAPTMLELGGYDALPDAQGISLVSGKTPDDSAAGSEEDADAVRRRLSGLGYI
ncbi:MAG: alkaline phosphatase family protein, partial [Planctomycetales bacterium]